MVIGRPEHAGTDLEGEFSDSNLMPITLETLELMPDTDAVLLRSRLTAEDFQSVGSSVDPATWTRSINPLFIVVTEASYP